MPTSASQDPASNEPSVSGKLSLTHTHTHMTRGDEDRSAGPA